MFLSPEILENYYYYYTPPLSKVLLSITQGLLQSKNIKWKIPETSNS